MYRILIINIMPSEWVPCTVCGKLMDPGQIPLVCQACCGDDNWDERIGTLGAYLAISPKAEITENIGLYSMSYCFR